MVPRCNYDCPTLQCEEKPLAFPEILGATRQTLLNEYVISWQSVKCVPDMQSEENQGINARMSIPIMLQHAEYWFSVASKSHHAFNVPQGIGTAPAIQIIGTWYFGMKGKLSWKSLQLRHPAVKLRSFSLFQGMCHRKYSAQIWNTGFLPFLILSQSQPYLLQSATFLAFTYWRSLTHPEVIFNTFHSCICRLD